MGEKTQRGDAFSIITLVLLGPDGRGGTVPEPLEQFLWKPIKTPLHGLREIIRALPTLFQEIRPVAELTADPKVRMTLSAGALVSAGPEPESEDVVLVRIENHGSQSVYLTGGVSFDRDNTNMHSMVMRDANGAFPTKRELRPGDGFTIPVALSVLGDEVPHITHFFFQDELGRMFRASEEETRRALDDSKS
jgi:hypothetical protein